jgi:hypothetical protein
MILTVFCHTPKNPHYTYIYDRIESYDSDLGEGYGNEAKLYKAFYEKLSKHIESKVTIINHSSLACNLCVDIPRPLKNFTANPRGQIIFRVSRLLIFLSEPILDLYMKIGREQVSAAWAVILTPTFPHLRLLTSAPAFSGETPFTADELVGDKI